MRYLQTFVNYSCISFIRRVGFGGNASPGTRSTTCSGLYARRVRLSLSRAIGASVSTGDCQSLLDSALPLCLRSNVTRSAWVLVFRCRFPWLAVPACSCSLRGVTTHDVTPSGVGLHNGEHQYPMYCHGGGPFLPEDQKHAQDCAMDLQRIMPARARQRRMIRYSFRQSSSNTSKRPRLMIRCN